MTPVVLEEILDFIGPALAGAPRLLEVGCGRGAVARALAARGREVTAIDLALPEDATGARFVAGDFLAFEEARSFDAILFVTSLHHIPPGRAVERAAALLRRGGLLVAEEFDLAAPDVATARWYYAMQERLARAGRFPREEIRGDDSTPPLARWREEHAHEPPLATGAEMLAAIGTRFSTERAGRGPYLWRSVGDRGVLERERRGIASGRLEPVGLRIVARRR